ncbi:WD40/YVTN/BNR-like repeat-containing protein [Derxia gummosa]|uniref:WD40/YVTN/BNR-like repeat-containing protein n=1 Tax=Derxia gummosa DSM 723 TaxID=1121388 RepID=A0A8B6X8N3_9BURK|nr:hypothetical protein [Derxia gummosa]
MNNRFRRAFATTSVAALIAAALAACGGGNGSSAEPPTDLAVTGGDGRVVATFTAKSGVEYWLFYARDASISKSNWVSLTGNGSIVNASSPQVVCSQYNDLSVWFAADGRTDGGPGGAFSTVQRADLRAAGATWRALASGPTALNGIGFAAERSCPTNGSLYTGTYYGVGPGGAIWKVSDADLYAGWAGLGGASAAGWTAVTTPTGFTDDLYAVSTYTASLNASSPSMVWLAVGAGGAALHSTDGTNWSVTRAASGSHAAMRAITKVGSTFIVVGDNGTIESTVDGSTWSTLTSGTTANLTGVTYGNGRLVAVGERGTVIQSTDGGGSWSAVTMATGSSAPTADLAAVAYGSYDINGGTATLTSINTFVAVGANGTILRSTDGGSTWTDISSTAGAGGSNLTGVAYTSRFVAVDASGAAWTSRLGDTWTSQGSAVTGGASRIVANSAGYLAVGASGAAGVAY